MPLTDNRIQQVTTLSPDQTRELGMQIGKKIPQATCLALYGDLGSGKTVFVQGLASGLDIPEGYDITSPTFTLINEYNGRLPLCHVDLYRVFGSDDAEAIGLFDIIGSQAVVAIEWAQRLDPDDLTDYVALRFRITGDSSRQIRFEAVGDVSLDWLPLPPTGTL